MNKKISLGICISLILVSIAATFAVTMVISKNIYNGIISNISQRSQMYDSVDEINQIITNNFYGTIEDQNQLNASLAEGYINGLGDPNSRYLDAEEYSASQNSERLSWSFEEVDSKLKTIMVGIFHNLDDAARKYGMEGNYVAGANIAGFLKVADAMNAQGII